ncbi:hypothetical protein [Methanofollis ethanolicus]|uniref:hypothetical protein n=1 Tax=Methanofollis ethanolicus TaxID=488124 RepID=UPI0008353254|nr:hypothetical protein [Methanofollis ethanolicus]
MIAANAPAAIVPGKTTSFGPVTLLEGISLTISATRGGGWVTTLSRGNEALVEDRAATLPWIDPRGPGRLAAKLHEARPTLDQKAIKGGLQDIFEAVKSSPDSPALVSAAVERAIGETAGVKIEMSDPPVYIIELTGGERLIFQNRELADPRPGNLNDRWLATHPGDALDATGKDFKEIRNYWFGIAERVEPTGVGSQWEPVAEALQIRLAPLPVGTDKDSLLKYGLFLEEQPDKSTILWVASNIIESVLKDHGKSITDSTFPEFLQRDRDLLVRSHRFRIGKLRCRAWGFNPDFRPDDVGITNLETLVDEDEGDQP